MMWQATKAFTTTTKTLVFFLLVVGPPAMAFLPLHASSCRPSSSSSSSQLSAQKQTSGSSSSSSSNADSARQLLEKARLLREEIEASEASSRRQQSQVAATTSTNNKSTDNTKTNTVGATKTTTMTTPWSLVDLDDDVTAYRLYVDIGREEGTWMEPRWGASGQRIEFTLDVAFTREPVLNKTIASLMVQDNKGGGSSSSSPVLGLATAPFARLRGGFDRMKCEAGAYRVDTTSSSNNKSRSGAKKTLRLFFPTLEGKTVGDISVPTDSPLYISLPVLPDSSLSRKEGIVSVRQYGWHTGWYSRESRIVGVVKAVPLAEAQAKDGF